MRCGGTFYYRFSRNLLQSLSVKTFENRLLFGKVRDKNRVVPFSPTRCTEPKNMGYLWVVRVTGGHHQCHHLIEWMLLPIHLCTVLRQRVICLKVQILPAARLFCARIRDHPIGISPRSLASES